MIPSIPEFYRGRTIFITGGSGFMGKVLVEKLLRSCPELDTIYLLLRPKKGKEAAARIADIIGIALFDRIRKENPGVLGKLVAVAGDVKEIGLGLSEADRRMLQDQVSVVFHSAASVRFDDPIRDSVLMNVRGTREVVDLALGMKKLEVMLHVSTTYCNFDKPEVFEKIYPAPGDWRTMIALMERNTDDHLLRCLTPKILGDLPNTYTYCKALSESLINDHRDKLPLVIVRPSVVLHSWEEPIPGWVDSFYGPVGMYSVAGFGIVRTLYGSNTGCRDHVPIDIAIKSMIYLAWHKVHFSEVTSLPVYNCCSMTIEKLDSETIDILLERFFETPLENVVWYPKPIITESRTINFFKVLFLHMLPAILIDFALKMMGKEPMMVKLQRRIYIANINLAPFSFTKIKFHNTDFLAAHADMREGDSKAFAYDTVITNEFEYTKKIVAGARLHLFKQPFSSIPSSKKRLTRLYWIHQLTKTLFFLLLFWLFGVSSMIRHGCSMIQNLYETLL